MATGYKVNSLLIICCFLFLSIQSSDNKTVLLSNIESAVNLLQLEIEDSLCRGGLAVGGPKCHDSFYGIQEFVDSFGDYMNIGSINASEEFLYIVNALNYELLVRSTILHNLSNAILSSCILYGDNLEDSPDLTGFDSLYFSGNNEIPARLPIDIEWNDIYQKKVSFTASTFRIPHNVNYYNNDGFRYDAMLSSLLDPLFIDLYQEYCASNPVLSRSEQSCQVYFGSVNGMFRIFPGSENPINEDGSYKSYDPRIRPWYVAAASGDTDIVILLDLSGSMIDRIDIVTAGILSIFDILGPLSNINIIGFSDKLQRTCLNNKLFEATEDNFNYLQEWLLTVNFGGYSDFEIAFDAAFDLISSHRILQDGSNCNTAILLITDSGNNENEDDILSLITRLSSNIDKVSIFTYSLGNDADISLIKSIANNNNGIYTHIADDDIEFIADKFSSFYKYYAFGAESNDELIISPPYFSFSTGAIGITISKPIFFNDSFVGVFGIDVPLSVLEDVIGDVPIGAKSYSFLMNQNGILLSHPLIPDSMDYSNGKYNQFKMISVIDIEPNEFVKNGVYQSMLNRESGYISMSITYKQSIGNDEYNGFISIDTDVIYFYSSIGSSPSSLSFAAVIWNDKQYEPPLIPSFGLERVKPKICPNHINIKNISELIPDEMDGCLGEFNLFHEIDLLLKCNNTKEWVEEAEIMNINTFTRNYDNIFSQSSFYNDKNISLKYSTYYLQSGLWSSMSDALQGINPTCNQLNNLQKLTNPLQISPDSNSIPYGGFKYEYSSNTLVAIYIFSSLYNWWKPSFLSKNSSIVSLYFGSYQGVHISYPGKVFSSSYNSLERDWYKEAISFPNYFVLLPPYIHSTTGKLVTGASTTIYAPNTNNQYIGVAGLNWEYNGFVKKWKNVMSDLCHAKLSFNRCYLITSSALFLYYEDMEYIINDKDISHKFLGDIEPTLMQSLIELKLFKKRKQYDVINNIITLSYLLDEDIFHSLTFSENFRSFEKNSGLYIIQHIENTNLYLIFIYDYLQIAYPPYCPDDEYCINVEKPGCIKYDTNKNGIIDDNDQCNIFKQDVCSINSNNNNNNNNTAISVLNRDCIQRTKNVNQCLLEKSLSFNMCLSDIDDILKSLICNDIINNTLSDVEIVLISISSLIFCFLFIHFLGFIIYKRREKKEKEKEKDLEFEQNNNNNDSNVEEIEMPHNTTQTETN